MYKLTAICLIVVAMGATALQADQCLPCSGDRQSQDIKKDVPFPFRADVPFPWKIIDGSWLAHDLEFVFKVIKETDFGTKYLNVEVYDVKTKAFIAQGVGVVKRDDNIVKTRITGPELDGYITLQAFRSKVSTGRYENYILATIRDAPNSSNFSYQYKLKKRGGVGEWE